MPKETITLMPDHWPEPKKEPKKEEKLEFEMHLPETKKKPSKAVKFALIFSLVLIILVGFSIFSFSRKRKIIQPPKIVIPKTAEEKAKEIEVKEETVSPETPLLPTELAPLRGALVRFSSELEKVYLVENDGSLRPVVFLETEFKGGEKLAEVLEKKVYTLSDRFKNVRRGPKVPLTVDFDPRILSPEELKNFID